MPETIYKGFTIFLGVPAGDAGQALNDNFTLCADHIASILNPHTVTASQVGNTTAQWNADQLQGRDLATTAPTGGQVLSWNAGNSEWEPAASGAGGDHATMSNLAYAASGHTGFEAAGLAATLDAAHLVTYNHANYDTAFGWGDHAGLYAAVGHTIVSHDTLATGAQLTTLTDGSNADALHAHAGVGGHTIASHSDTTATGTELETLTDGSDADALHAHAVNDTHAAGDGSDHADVAANTVLAHAAAHTVASHSDTTATGAELETLTNGSNADALHVHAWSVLTGTPTTLAGYSISDTKANFDTACSDGDFMYTGDAPTAHTIVSHDTTGTGAELTSLTDGSNADTLHIHDYPSLDVDLSAMIDTFEGMAFDKPSLSVVDDTGLKLDVETLGGGDMDFWIGDQRVTLDCTTGAGAGGTARVGLTAGADANTPATNYIYITAAGAVGTLAASTTLPTGAFAWIGKIIVPDAVTWGTTGEYAIQRYTESFENDSRGLLSHAREKLRALGAVYISGCGQTLTITPGTPDTVHLEVASGAVYQLHRQTWPAIATGPYYYGNGTTIYGEIADLASALALADGTPIITQQRFNLVIWGAVNYEAGDCKLFVNLPTSVYPTDGAAQADSDNSADYTVPDDMRSVAFMVARVALHYSSAGGGDWTELGVYSLLGTPPGARSGGAGAVASTEFVDSTFRLYDNADATKMIAFEASTITTATTRTLTVPDASGTIALVENKLSVFAATTSAELAGVISDETGTGLLVFATDSVLTTPQINDTSADHQYIFAVSELAADRTVTLPLLLGNDTFVFEAFGATLTNKSIALGGNTLTGTKAEFDTAATDGNFMWIGDAPTAHNHNIGDLAGVDITGPVADIELFSFDLGSGDWINRTFAEAGVAAVANPLSQFAATTSAQLAGVISDETGTGLLVFATDSVLTTPQINDTSSDHQYIFAVSELAADRTVTLPLLLGNDTFVFNDFGATLTNKTIAFGSNTVSGTMAEFDTACTDGNFAYAGGAFHDGFSDYDGNDHIDHTAVSMTVAGTANEVSSSAGAQDISASRTWTLGIADNPIIPGTGGIEIPQGNNAARIANEGVLRLNTEGNTTEIYRDGGWVDLESGGGGGGGTVQGTDETYDIQATLDGATDGDPRGENTVDLSTIRSNAAMVAAGVSSVIGGGEDNLIDATGPHGVIGGGEDNTIDADSGSSYSCYHGVISGGDTNRIGADGQGANLFCCTIGGGQANVASGLSYGYTTVSGGYNNDAIGDYACVGGGNGNTASDFYSTVSGGYNNTAAGARDTISGGGDNSTIGSSNYGDVVGGGTSNTISSYSSGGNTIGGGYTNIVSGSYPGELNTIGGGNTNTVGSASAGYGCTISGGYFNTADGLAATVIGGASNTASGDYATASGNYSSASGQYSFCCGKYASDSGYYGCFVFCDSNTSGASGPAAADTAYFEVAGGLQLVTGNEGAGKHLLSDANGVGNWAVPDKVVTVRCVDPGTALTTGDGKGYFTVPAEFTGMDLTGVAIAVYTASSSGDPTVQIHNLTDTTDMLSTLLTIDGGTAELNSYTAATPAVIIGAEDDVVTGDILRFDCDVAGTGVTGLDVILTFSMP